MQIRRRRWVRGIAVAGGAGYLALQWLGRTWGTTSDERWRELPGDDLIAMPMAETNHGITIDARPEDVWPWLLLLHWQAGGWAVVELEEARHLVLRSTRDLPPSWERRLGAWIDWTWAFVLEPVDGERTRLLVRSRLRAGPPPVTAAYLLGVVPADFVVSHQLLRDLRAQVEAAQTTAV